jgi:hypothetical protein
MKNAAKHAQHVKALAKRFAKEHASSVRPSASPLEALILAALSEGFSDSAVEVGRAAIDAEYVDANELRVATALELQEILEPAYGKAADVVAERIQDLLNAVFDAEGRLSLDRIASMSKREQRPALRHLRDRSPVINDFVEGFVALVAFEIGTVPIDTGCNAVLEKGNAVEPGTTPGEAQRFVEQNVKLDDCWPMFVGLRKAAERADEAPKSTKKPAKRSAKKAPKKVVKKATRKTG